MALNYRDYPVLFVDDEPQNLVTFRYALDDQFNVLTASSGEAALTLLEQRPIAVLVTDQRMPGMSGVDVCARAQEMRPETVRIIITAYADLHAVVDAVNRGQISRYMVKPWRNEELIEVLRTAIEFVHIQGAMQDMELRLLRGGQARGAVTAQDKLMHEISNPLSALLLTVSHSSESVDGACRALESGDTARASSLLAAAREAQQDALASVHRMEAIFHRIRSGDDDVPASGVHCEAARVTDATARILRRDIERCARLTVVLQGNPTVAIATSALGQIVLNLLLNASQAIEEANMATAAITVELRSTTSHAVLTVSDTGPGIPSEYLEQVFQPYFTTRSEGTGLGLAIVRDLVQKAGGDIQVESTRGEGTRFEITLPLFVDNAARARAC